MRRMFRGRAGVVLGFVLGAMIATAATAGAASLITGRQIKDGTITAKDLSAALRAQVAKSGKAGPAGAVGPKGDAGAKGDPGAQRLSSGLVHFVAAPGDGVSDDLLTVGPVTWSATCIQVSGSTFQALIDARSSQGGLTASSFNASVPLGANAAPVWTTTQSSGQWLRSDHLVVVDANRTVQIADVTIGVHQDGSDCVASVDVTSS